MGEIDTTCRSIRAVLVLVILSPLQVSSSVLDPDYDCQLRELARDYTQEVVLSTWSSDRASIGLKLVEQGLKLSECNISSAKTEAPPPRQKKRDSGETATVTLYVATTGNDSGTGSESNPFKTISGAQSAIRKLYPSVATRPAIVVNIAGGNYFYGNAGSDHLTKATEYSETFITRFTELDSGASASSPITYTTQPGQSTQARFIGGVALSDLAWVPAPGMPPGVVKTTVPDTVLFDTQDQLFLVDGETVHPLIRGRTPNGKPWIPLDGYNQTVTQTTGLLDVPPVITQCSSPLPPPSPPPPLPPGRPIPAPGQCANVSGVSLLAGWPNIPGASIASTTVPSAEACEAICHADPCCRGYTWHDESTGAYWKQCFVLKNPSVDPWMTSFKQAGHFSGVCDSSGSPAQCHLRTGTKCMKSVVECAMTNVSQVTGVIGVSTLSGSALAGTTGIVKVEKCLEHLLDVANDWTEWKAASYGLSYPCTNGTNCANVMYTEYNFPLWFGPWASGITIDTSQETGGRNWTSYSWTDVGQVTVHAMADGEWGGVQFRAKSANISEASGKPTVSFSHGGYQQARGATLSDHNRFYAEGSVEFVDVPGEWALNVETRELFVFPPTGISMDQGELVLTQTDQLFEFVGSTSDPGNRVENIVLTNLSFGLTSAQYFRPHEETSGGDYATHRAGAIKMENVTGITLSANNFSWIGGNAVILSASVRNVTVTTNVFQYIGTSGVAIQGKTGVALMDGRDGEAMTAAKGAALDNGVRLPKYNVVSHNIFADYGVWDKQSACYHKALAPGNLFLNNVCFNASRHGVNFQDGMGGGGIAEGNVMFNLNRETSDTTAFNSWNRRNYITSDLVDPTIGVLIPPTNNEWRRNLVLARDYFGIRDGNGNALRNDDGASYYTHSNNVLYAAGGNPGVQFNGGTQIHTRGNLILLTSAGWNLGPTPDVMSMFNDTIVDTGHGTFTGNCRGLGDTQGSDPGIYTGDFNLVVQNSTGNAKTVDFTSSFCAETLELWQQQHAGQDIHSATCSNANGECSAARMLAMARTMMWDGQ